MNCRHMFVVGGCVYEYSLKKKLFKMIFYDKMSTYIIIYLPFFQPLFGKPCPSSQTTAIISKSLRKHSVSNIQGYILAEKYLHMC